MSEEMKLILEELKKINGRLEGMDTRFDGIESQLSEHSQILRALDDRGRVQEAKLEAIEFSVNKIQGELVAFKEETTNNFLQVNERLDQLDAETFSNRSRIRHLERERGVSH